MTSRIWAGALYVTYVIGALICVILDQAIFHNGHHPITNNFLPLIFLFAFIYCLFDVKGLSEKDAIEGAFWIFCVFSWIGPFYMLARLAGFTSANVRYW